MLTARREHAKIMEILIQEAPDRWFGIFESEVVEGETGAYSKTEGFCTTGIYFYYQTKKFVNSLGREGLEEVSSSKPLHFTKKAYLPRLIKVKGYR